jgi:NAD(P)H dehydrogenase (quinone)
MTRIAIIYHSGFGHTEVQAKAISIGANSIEGVKACLHQIDTPINIDLNKITRADAIIFGSPTYMGTVSAPFKAFMDTTSDIWVKQLWKDKIAAGFTNSHSLCGDKLNTLIQLTLFSAQHGMIWVGQTQMNQSPKGEAGKPDVQNRMGGFLGAMAQSENDSPAVTPPSGDRATAEKLGVRVALITKMLHPIESCQPC